MEQSSDGTLVCAEVHFLPHMNLRPFLADAGGIHMYAWAPNGRPPYFSDPGAGETVLAVNTSGRARPVTVGRIKAEVRLLCLIQRQAQDRSLDVLVQDDWHVRVFDATGEVRNSTGIHVSRDGHSGFLVGTAVAALATVLSLFRPRPDSHD